MAARTSQVSENMDEKLDFLSPKFEPLKALYTENLQPPVPNIYIFNNLAEYAQAIKEGKVKSSESTKPAKGKASLRQTATRTRNLKPEYKPTEKEDVQERLKSIAEANASSIAKSKTEKKVEGRVYESKLQEFILAEEAFKADQVKKKRMNVIDRMEACTEGPFSILHTCLTKRLKVKVWTRRYKGLRGVLAGYLVAFDKHMNLALFDVDEVYTLEERLEQPEANTETKGTRKNEKKKRKKVKNQIENKPSHEASNVETNDQNTTLASPNEVVLSSTQVPGCEEKIADMDAERSVNCESPTVRPMIDAQTGKGTKAACKDSSVLDSDTIRNHGLQDISMDTPDEDSLAPSAEALSAALHGFPFPLVSSDGRLPLTLGQTDELSSEKCRSIWVVEPSTDSIVQKNESDSPVTKLKSTLTECTTDTSSEGVGDYNTSSVAPSVDLIDNEVIVGIQLSNSFLAENKQMPYGSGHRKMGFQGEWNSERRVLDLFPSHVSCVGAGERMSSTTECNTHSAATDGMENTCSDALHGNSCGVHMKDNCDDVAVVNKLPLIDEDIVMTKKNRKSAQMEYNDQSYHLIHAGCSRVSRELEIGQNAESLSNSEATLHVSSFPESKPVMTKDSEMIEEKCDFIEGGLFRGNSDTTDKITPACCRKENTKGDRTEGSINTSLEHSNTGDEKLSTKGMETHTITVPCSTLNDTQQEERSCIENLEIIQNKDQPQNVYSKTRLQNRTKERNWATPLEQCTKINETPPVNELAPIVAKKEESEYLENLEVDHDVDKEQDGSTSSNLQRENEEGSWHPCSNHISLGQIRTFASVDSELVLNALVPLISNEENDSLLAWENSHNEGTVNMINAEEHAVSRCDAVQMPKAESLGCTGSNIRLFDEGKRFFNLHEATQRLTVDSVTCGDLKRPMKPLCTDIKTDSSHGVFISDNEDPPFRNEEGGVSSLSFVDGTPKIEGEVTLDRGTCRNSVDADQFKNSRNDALEISIIVTNNLNMQDDENGLFDFVASKASNYVPDESVFSFKSTRKEAEAELIDVQGGSLGPGVASFVSCREGHYLCSSDCGQQTVKNSLDVCLSEPSKNVNELPGDRKSEVSQTVQSEPSCGEVRVTRLLSGPNKASDMSGDSVLPQEKTWPRTKAFDTAGDSSVAMSSEGNMESAYNSLKGPGKEHDAKNKSGSELSKNQANALELKSEDYHPFGECTCRDCSKTAVAEDTKLGSDEPLQNTVAETNDNACEVQKEEGEISSDEEDASEGKTRETEDKKTLDAQTTLTKENVETPKAKSKETLEAHKLRKEEKEEGELSSSDSDAEVLLKTPYTQQGGTSTSKSTLFYDRGVATEKGKQLHPARRHSSSEEHHTLTRERSRSSAVLGGKRRSSLSATANTDLRTRLSEIRNKRTTSGNVRSATQDVEESVKMSGGTEKCSNKVKESVPHRGKDGKSSVKSGHKVKVKDSELKTREAQKNSSKTGSVKEDNNSGRLSKKDQLEHTPKSSKKATRKSQGSSPTDKNVKKESTGGNKAESRPTDVQRTAKESDGRIVLKTSKPESRHKTKETRKTTTRNVDSAAVVTKDVKKESTRRQKAESHPDDVHGAAKESNSKSVLKATQLELRPKTKVTANRSKGNVESSAVVMKGDRRIETLKMSKQSCPASKPKPKTTTCKLITENNSPDEEKTAMKNEAKGRTTRSSETPKSASGSSVERPSKRQFMNKATLEKKPKLLEQPLPSSDRTVTERKQVERARGRQSSDGKTPSKSNKPCNVNSGKKSVAASGNVSKVENSENGGRRPVKVTRRILLKKTPEKSPANAISKAKVSQNPRKRCRSVDSTETRHGKKMKIEEVKDSLPKQSTVSSTHKLPKQSKELADCTSNSENVPPCSNVELVGAKTVPNIGDKHTFEHECERDSKGENGKTDDSIQAKPILFGRNKCLVFKRRHVNQLFVRGDNVVMVAYAK